MSDYIYNNEMSGLNNHETCFYQLNDNVGENGYCAQEKVFGQYEEDINVLKRAMFGQNCPQRDEGVLTENIDVCSEWELGRPLSSLIQLLKSTRQSSLQMKATCGISQRPPLVKSSKSKGDTDPSLDIHTERKFILHPNSSVETGIAGCADYLAEPEMIMPAVLGSTGTTFPNNVALPAFPQTDEKARTNEIPGVFERSISAQTLVTPVSDIQVERDRQRKHARNKREKRRRSAITDSITELGNLLSEDAKRGSCRQKCTILKKSIDYIKRLRDQNVIQRFEDKMRKLNMEIKTLTQRLEKVEISTNISSPEQNRIETTSKEQHINRCMTTSPVTCLKTSSSHSDPPLNKSLSNVPKVPSVSTSLSFDDVWDGFSSTLLVDEVTSLPKSFEKSTDARDCYI